MATITSVGMNALAPSTQGGRLTLAGSKGFHLSYNHAKGHLFRVLVSETDVTVRTDKDKKDLGVHTEMFSDWIIEHIKRPAITATKKTINRDKVTASFETARSEGATIAAGGVQNMADLTFAGGDVTATTERWGRRINHVHTKDIRKDVLKKLKAEDWSFLKGVLEGVFTVPGDGSIDFGAFMKSLKTIDYSGWVVIEAEQDPAVRNPLLYQTLGLATLKRQARETGLDKS